MSRTLRVLDPGALTTVQDAGRLGLAHLGVPRSGWLDPGAAALADRLVGNPEDAAVLECLLGGLSFEVGAAMTVAVTGAACGVRVDGRAAPYGAAVSVAARQVVTLGPVTHGARCYVAVSGGLLVDRVLGSRATDTLSGLGPPDLTRGTVLPVGRAVGAPSSAEVGAAAVLGALRLGCTAGPRSDWFTTAALSTLTDSTYSVHPDSNRVGLRLSGPPLERARSGELPSEGLVLGAVQVPADGQPLVFLNDHPTTGGYPVVAVLDPDDVGRCAQLRPGDRVSFLLRRPAGGAR